MRLRKQQGSELPLAKEPKASQLAETNVSERRAFEFNLKERGQRTVPAPNTILGDSNSFEYEVSSRDSQNSKEETIGQYALSSASSSNSLEEYSIDKLKKNSNSSSSVENEVFFEDMDKC